MIDNDQKTKLRYDYVPVLIPTLNRYNHLKECIESLEKCLYANETEIFISVDYPPDCNYSEGHSKVTEYLKTKDFSCFKDVHLFFQERNLGAYDNLYFLEEKMPYEDQWFILLEDDVVVSKGYLAFVNNAIIRFADDENFAGVCGYNCLRTALDTQRWYKGKNLSYGSALNLSVINMVKEDASVLYQKPIRLTDFVELLNFSPIDARVYMDYFIYKPKLYFDRNYNIAPIDYVIHNVLFFREKYVVTPTISMVRNMGNDGTGLHSDYDSKLSEFEKAKEIDDSLCFDFSSGSCIERKKLALTQKTVKTIKSDFENTIQAVTKYMLISIVGEDELRKYITNKSKRKK